MIRLFIRHEVQDFAKWLEKYAPNTKYREDHGVVHDAVYGQVDNPCDVTVIHDFATSEAARTMVEDLRAQKIFEAAGVVGEPQIWIAELIEN